MKLELESNLTFIPSPGTWLTDCSVLVEASVSLLNVYVQLTSSRSPLKSNFHPETSSLSTLHTTHIPLRNEEQYKL